MPVRFAAARSSTRSPVARALAPRAPGHPANDGCQQQGFDPLLEEALRHFAAHGLGAAAAASTQAERAGAAGDEAARRRLLAIAAMFGRRSGTSGQR